MRGRRGEKEGGKKNYPSSSNRTVYYFYKFSAMQSRTRKLHCELWGDTATTTRHPAIRHEIPKPQFAG